MGERRGRRTLVVGITGGTGSGKTTFTESLQRELDDQAIFFSSDMYYKDQSLLPLKERFAQNMDCPEAFDNQLLITHIKKLVSGKDVEAPIYDFTDHTRKENTRHLRAKPILIVEGLLIFAKPQLRSLFDLKIFLEVPADLRLCRRILRDVAERRSGSIKAAIDQYLSSARPMDKVYVLPQKKYADLVISTEEISSAQVQLTVDRIKEEMSFR
jgi:uridine kinase